MSQQQFHKRIKEPSTSSELKTKYVLDNESGVDEEKQRHGWTYCVQWVVLQNYWFTTLNNESILIFLLHLFKMIIFYKKYATFAGWSMVFLKFVSAFSMQASHNGNVL